MTVPDIFIAIFRLGDFNVNSAERMQRSQNILNPGLIFLFFDLPGLFCFTFLPIPLVAFFLSLSFTFLLFFLSFLSRPALVAPSTYPY